MLVGCTKKYIHNIHARVSDETEGEPLVRLLPMGEKKTITEKGKSPLALVGDSRRLVGSVGGGVAPRSRRVVQLLALRIQRCEMRIAQNEGVRGVG